jgi:hypothetical protein
MGLVYKDKSYAISVHAFKSSAQRLWVSPADLSRVPVDCLLWKGFHFSRSHCKPKIVVFPRYLITLIPCISQRG